MNRVFRALLLVIPAALASGQSLPLTISSLSPGVTTATAPGFELTVRGTGFIDDGVSDVLWNSTPLSTAFVDPTTLTALVPSSLILQPGTAQIRVANFNEDFSNILNFTINPRPTVQGNPPNAQVGSPYEHNFQVTGGTAPYSWFLASGNLPPGLGFFPSSTTSTVRGTPTQTGTYSAIVRVVDSVGVASDFSFAIIVNVGELVITTPTPLPEHDRGRPVDFRFQASGGVPPYLNWAVVTGSLPPGVLLQQATGRLTGAPTVAGTFTFTMRVFDSGETQARKQFTWTIVPAVAPIEITTGADLPEAAVGVEYQVTLGATGGETPYTWSLESPLPLGLNLTSAGVLAGVPQTAGNFSFTIAVAGGGQSARRVFRLLVRPRPLEIITTQAPAGQIGTAYTTRFEAAGGTPPYRWALDGAPPAGLALDASTGVLAGTPTAPGQFPLLVRVSDAQEATATRTIALEIAAAPLPTMSIDGLAPTIDPQAQTSFTVNLNAAYPAGLEGTVTLSFTPDVVVPAASYPQVRLVATGGLTADFTIPAGRRRALFGIAEEVGVQVGNTAGRIRVAITALRAGGASVLPATPPAWEMTIARQAPAISNVCVVTAANTLTVRTTGYSTPREVTRATYRFTPATGANLQTLEVQVQVGDAFRSWYQGAASAEFGTSFRLTQQFTVSGQLTDVTSVAVILANGTGESAASTVALTAACP